MTRALIFFAAFFGAIVVPQLIAHGLNYLYPAQPRFGEDETALRATPSGFAEPSAVFGKSVRLDLMQDPRPIFPQVLAGAQVAQYGMTGTGATVLAARFASDDAATQARYALFRMLGKIDAQQDERGFFHFIWPQSGYSAIAGSGGRTFMMWVAPDRASVERLRSESGAFSARPSAARSGVGGFVDAVRGSPPMTWFALIGMYALFVSWLFLRLVTWATVVPPQPVATAASASALKDRLLRVRFLESPIAIGLGNAADELVVDWKYADAKWVDHARAHGMRKSHRLILELDEATRTVRCREFHTESGWNAGAGGASIQWKASWEIVFYQYEHERVFGLQVQRDGSLAPALSYAYTFDLREMKNPIIAAVTAAGWQWRQVFFFSPPWLRWLHG
ncbi:MAG TPA: hypothetical protein VL180_09015 [Burkholderiales bacterium]|nr:hypothetical protein [Burkholderiales bacterium]